jgi:hypothetical protein
MTSTIPALNRLEEWLQSNPEIVAFGQTAAVDSYLNAVSTNAPLTGRDEDHHAAFKRNQGESNRAAYNRFLREQEDRAAVKVWIANGRLNYHDLLCPFPTPSDEALEKWFGAE